MGWSGHGRCDSRDPVQATRLWKVEMLVEREYDVSLWLSDFDRLDFGAVRQSENGMSVGGQFSLLASMEPESIETGVKSQRDALAEPGLCRTPVKGHQHQDGGVQEGLSVRSGGAISSRRKQGRRRERKEIGQDSQMSGDNLGSKTSNGKKRHGQRRGQKNNSVVAEQQGGGGSNGAVPDTPRLAPDLEAARSEGSSADSSIELIEHVLMVGEDEKQRNKAAGGKQRRRGKNNEKAKAVHDRVSGEKDSVCIPQLGDTVSDSRKLCARSNGVLSIGMEIETKSKMGGPVAIDALAKEGSKKKEDKWILKPHNTWEIPDMCTGKTNLSAWGVFDGHGGRQVATFASHTLLKSIAEYCSVPCPVEEKAPLSSDMPLGLPHTCDDDVMEWKLQNELIRRLPGAIEKSFLECDATACKRFANGGTTATIALLCGWQLIVANVGDSCAYLDTGSEVLAVSGNHRLEDNKNEVSRIEASGGEVAPSSIDGKPAGPIRVWPGGLAMSRTIGDRDSENLTAAMAEVFQITIPSDGARLFIASDGLWDAVHPKTAAHHTRDMTSSDAAHKLLSMAIKKDNLKDDVTVIVVDFCPSEDDRMPPGLSMHKLSGKKGKGHVDKLAHAWQPLLRETHNWSRDEYVRRVDVSKAISMKLEEERLVKMEQEERAYEQSREDHAGGDKESGLYHELMNLKLSPNDFADDFEQGNDWVTVKAHGDTHDSTNDRVKNSRNAKNSRRGQGKFRSKPKRVQKDENTNHEIHLKSSVSGDGLAHKDATETQGNKPSRPRKQFRKKRPFNSEKPRVVE
eukprot:jgi/Picsp_1/2974/NSC_01198-R1_protein phosphatase 2c 15